jgi:tRNA nucleotidyltransferase (CCA-adding enzyme)
MDNLFKYKGDNNYDLYTLLFQYDTEFLLYIMAKTSLQRIKRLISTYFTKLKGTKIKLTGKDLKLMGFRPGPLYKEIFEALMEARLNDRISTKEDEIKFVKETFGSHLEASSIA